MSDVRGIGGLDPEQAAELEAALYRAAAHPHGLALRTNDPQQLRQAAHKLRTRLGDPSLAGLRFFLAPANPTGALWLTAAAPGISNNGKSGEGDESGKVGESNSYLGGPD